MMIISPIFYFKRNCYRLQVLQVQRNNILFTIHMVKLLLAHQICYAGAEEYLNSL